MLVRMGMDDIFPENSNNLCCYSWDEKVCKSGPNPTTGRRYLQLSRYSSSWPFFPMEHPQTGRKVWPENTIRPWLTEMPSSHSHWQFAPRITATTETLEFPRLHATHAGTRSDSHHTKWDAIVPYIYNFYCCPIYFWLLLLLLWIKVYKWSFRLVKLLDCSFACSVSAFVKDLWRRC